MVDFIDEVRTRSNRFAQRLEHLETEEATKNSLVMPFIQMLGYNIFDPTEVVPEFTADFGNRRGERVDYALLQNGQPIILIEAKRYGSPLQVEQESQLFRYFAATSARFGILTDGILYRFFSDLDEPKQMDRTPFLEFDMLNFTEGQAEQLKQFHKENFDLTGTVEAALESKYTNEIKSVLAEEFTNPSRDLARMIARRVYGSGTPQRILSRFEALSKTAFAQFINDRINARLKSALEQGGQGSSGEPVITEAHAEPPPAVELPRDLHMKTSGGMEAKARQDEDGVVVLAGSRVWKKEGASIRDYIAERRRSALEQGLLVDDGDTLQTYQLTQDCNFSSLSAAACFVLGWDASGPQMWRTTDGTRLNQTAR